MKAIKFIMGVAVALSLGFSAVSCSNDDTDYSNVTPPQTDTKMTIAKAEVGVNFKFTEDFLNAYDVAIEYTDSNGVFHSEAFDKSKATITKIVELSTEFVGKTTNVYNYKKLIETKIPQNINTQIKATPKSNIPTFDSEIAYFGFGFDYQIKMKNANNEVIKMSQNFENARFMEYEVDQKDITTFSSGLGELLKLTTATFQIQKNGQYNAILPK